MEENVDTPRLTSLCYIEKDGRYLLLHRTKKENDENHDKWIGVGGKFELGESPEECAAFASRSRPTATKASSSGSKRRSS